ncbi:unnamed protein product, partial [Rotaria socialis]
FGVGWSRIGRLTDIAVRLDLQSSSSCISIAIDLNIRGICIIIDIGVRFRFGIVLNISGIGVVGIGIVMSGILLCIGINIRISIRASVLVLVLVLVSILCIAGIGFVYTAIDGIGLDTPLLDPCEVMATYQFSYLPFEKFIFCLGNISTLRCTIAEILTPELLISETILHPIDILRAVVGWPRGDADCPHP